ncbi:MAG TPA: cation diffusion facilitator family transporter [Thermoanaerobaculia bacterium]|nr:cation diffusion facilitator family transporter [Thermoanaerobaculia bacterium]
MHRLDVPTALGPERSPVLAVAASAFLVVLKTVGALATNSLALGAAALDSLIDCFVYSTSFLLRRRSAAPPDSDHAFGHGKFENLAMLGQGLFLIVAAGGLVVAGVGRLRSGEVPRETTLGVTLLSASLLVNLFVIPRLQRAAERSGSPSLKADSLHFRTDLWVNGSALAALLVVALTGWAPADPLVALAVASLVFRSASVLVLEALGDLSDRGLPPPLLRRIEVVVASFAPEVVGMHDLQTRKSGSENFISLHLEIPRDTSFVAAHEITVRVLHAVEEAVPRSKVFVHGDPV